MTIYEATGYFINKLMEKGESIDLSFCDKTLKGTHCVTEQEKESIFITIPSIDVEVCLHNAGINLKVTEAKVNESPVLAEKFPITTETGVAKKLFKYSKETPDTEKLDEAVAFIKSLA